jgi:predicted acyltransferase
MDQKEITIFLSSGLLLPWPEKMFNTVFPYNKNLWSSSYVLLTSGLAILLLAFFYLLTDRMKSVRNPNAFKAIGKQRHFVFFASELVRPVFIGNFRYRTPFPVTPGPLNLAHGKASQSMGSRA